MGIPQLNATELYFLKKAQKELSLKGCMLSKCVLIEEDILEIFDLRAKNQIPKFYGTPYLAVLNHSYSLCEVYTERAHRGAHEGISSTLQFQAARVDY